MERRVTGNCHARCGVGEKPEAPLAPEAHLSLFLQNKAQLQALFKDTYQAIIGNCVRPYATGAL